MFRPLAAESGVEFVGAPGRGMREIIESDEGQELLRSLGNPLTLPRRIEQLFGDDVDHLYRAVLDAADGMDAVLCYPATFPALEVADQLDLPVVQVHHVPAMPTKEFPAAVDFVHRASLGSAGNRLSYVADAAATSMIMRRPVNAARRNVLGAKRGGVVSSMRRRRDFAGAVVGVSPKMLSRPDDWPEKVTTTGYWWPRAIDAPPLDQDTCEFLDGEGPTIFFTLGSTPLEDPQTTTNVVVGAAHDAGVRLVLQRGWGGLGDGADSDDVLVVGDLAYPELFDRVTALVHHGGAGTTALGMRHGRPSLVIPAIADQFFWGNRLHALRVGPSLLALKDLSRERLAKRMRKLVTEPTYARNAEVIGEALRAEDGVAVAVRAVEDALSGVRSAEAVAG
jgi:UDP:flavonoid glycosyltransferase YjiC (YdhE family)